MFSSRSLKCLAVPWMASHLEKRLTKDQVMATSVPESVDVILNEDVDFRKSALLTLGLSRIHFRQVRLSSNTQLSPGCQRTNKRSLQTDYVLKDTALISEQLQRVNLTQPKQKDVPQQQQQQQQGSIAKYWNTDIDWDESELLAGGSFEGMADVPFHLSIPAAEQVMEWHAARIH